MRQKIIKRILVLSMVGVMAFALASCANTSSQDEPSQSQPTTQEIETTPTPTPSEEPTPSQDTTPTPNEDEPSEAMPSQEPPSSEPIPTPSEATPTNEPTTTQEPTQSQEPIQTQAPTTTTTPTPTTPPTNTPIHTHSFIGGNCSTPSICECGEIGSYGDHNWATRHIDEVGHYEGGETYTQIIFWCNCGEVFHSDDPEEMEKWYKHNDPFGDTWWHSYRQGTREKSKNQQYVVDVQAHDETYCTICGAIQ